VNHLERYHIGANDLTNEGIFLWTDGTPFSYTHWASGQPDNALSSEDCSEMLGTGFHATIFDGDWNDIPCSFQATTGYFCVRNSTRK